MIIVEPSAKIEGPIYGLEMIKEIEAAGRTCYKSENLIQEGSAEKFINKILDSGHFSVIEHGAISVRFICDRGISHEIVRHRLASFSQESTRYCNYSKNKFGNEISVIMPSVIQKELESGEKERYDLWCYAVQEAERIYFNLLNLGTSPQNARSVLPTCTKTEIVMTANPREWRHFFSQRCAPAAHPDMQVVAKMALLEFSQKIPFLYDDLAARFLIPNKK